MNPYETLVWALELVVPLPDNSGFKAHDLVPAAYKALQQREAERSGGV